MTLSFRSGSRIGVYCDLITVERRRDAGCSGRTNIVGDNGADEVDIGTWESIR